MADSLHVLWTASRIRNATLPLRTSDNLYLHVCKLPLGTSNVSSEVGWRYIGAPPSIDWKV